MSNFSLAQAQLYRLLNNGQEVKILNQTDLGRDRYALTLAGTWFGQRQVRCYFIVRYNGEWLTTQLSNEWIAETARLLQPMLSEEKRE